MLRHCKKGGTFYIVESADGKIDGNGEYVYASEVADDGSVKYYAFPFSAFSKEADNGFGWNNVQWVLGVDSLTTSVGSAVKDYYYSTSGHFKLNIVL